MNNKLSPDQPRRACDPASFSFQTTAELPQKSSIIDQPRGTRAIEFGLDIGGPGYNIYVLGEAGTGRATAIERFLRERAAKEPVPQDWVYVNNFAEPHKPRALNLRAGLGAKLRDDMQALVEHLRREVPKAFDRAEYNEAREQIQRTFEMERDRIFETLQTQANAANFGILRSAAGLMIAPLVSGHPMPPEAFEALPPEQKKTLEAARRDLEHGLEEALRTVRDLEKTSKEKVQNVDRQVAASVVGHVIGELKAKYAAHEETVFYLGEVERDLIANVSDFRPEAAATPGASPADNPWGTAGAGAATPFRRYAVNLIVDHSRTQGAPVVVEFNPNYSNLMGRVEHEARFGALATDFSLIKGGALHAANGGYLVVRARNLLLDPFAWDALKRSLIAGRIQAEDIAGRGGLVVTRSLDPEPIPLDLKVVLVGPPGLYYWLHGADDDFETIFKVKADFDSVMPRTPGSERDYAEFVAARCCEEKLRHFDRAAVARIVEYGSWLAEDQGRLSARFGDVADVVREASYWAGEAEREAVTAGDVRQAIEEKVYRSNLVEEHARERIQEGTIFIDTAGAIVGQVNGLTVAHLGDYAYGQPTRITARTFVGHTGVVQIDREVNLAGSIHNKGLLTLSGYFGGQCAADAPPTLSAQISFEQSYSGIEGDSASSAELYALLSSLAGRPVKQGIAVTGSVNQKGEIQPIGGVNEKIEGSYVLCKARGLTGEQGVMIPASNVVNLMLEDETVQAAAEGKFQVWAVKTVDEGIEILTGVPAGVRDGTGRYPKGTIHYDVLRALKTMADKADRKEHRKKRKERSVAKKPPKRKK